MRTRNWKRGLSMLLTVVLVASLVLGALPGIVQEVSAATVDAGTLGAGKDGQLINGVYEIYFPGTDLCITPVDNGYDAGTVMELTTVQHWYSQRWIIEYGGTYDLTAASGDGGITIPSGASITADFWHRTATASPPFPAMAIPGIHTPSGESIMIPLRAAIPSRM